MLGQILSILTASKDRLILLGTEYVPRVLSSISLGEAVGYITVAVMLAVSYSIYSQVAVPRHLRHLPFVPLYKIALARIRQEPADITEQKLFLPVYKKYGLVVVSGYEIAQEYAYGQFIATYNVKTPNI